MSDMFLPAVQFYQSYAEWKSQISNDRSQINSRIKNQKRYLFFNVVFIYLEWGVFPEFLSCDLKFGSLFLSYGMGMAKNRYWSAKRLADLSEQRKQNQRCSKEAIDPRAKE